MFENTPRILIYALNGIGLGHVNRTVLIAQDLHRLLNKKATIVFVTEAENTKLIRDAHFPCYNLPLQSGPTAISNTVKGLTVSSSFNKPFIKNIILQFKPHITILTFTLTEIC